MRRRVRVQTDSDVILSGGKPQHEQGIADLDFVAFFEGPVVRRKTVHEAAIVAVEVANRQLSVTEDQQAMTR